MHPNKKTNDKENLQANQQPKKTWQEPVMTTVNLNSGTKFVPEEFTAFNAGPNGSQPW